MSWQAYVDANLVGTGAVTQAGIYDLQGNPWAYTQSPPFAAQIAEVAAVSAHFAAPSGLAATGVTIAGVKYMYVSGEENTEIYAKKGNEGVAFYRCNTCILVAYHNDKIQPGQCRTVLAKLGDFLKDSVRAICLRLASNAPPPPPARASPYSSMPCKPSTGSFSAIVFAYRQPPLRCSSFGRAFECLAMLLCMSRDKQANGVEGPWLRLDRRS